MREPARGVMAAAFLCCLALLQQVGPGGAWALGCGLVILALALLTPPPARRGLRFKEDLRTLLQVLGLLLALAVSLGTLLLESDAAGYSLAWLARTLLLGSLLLTSVTTLAWLPAHAGSVLLGLWSASAFHDTGHPEALALVLAGLTLGLAAQGVLLGHAAEQERAASASITTGVAPTPWGFAPRRLPVLTVVFLGLLPLAFGVAWPRLDLSSPPQSEPPAPEPSALPSPMEIGEANDRVEFSPQLALDESRGAGLREDTEIARVSVTPARQVLYLRGAALVEARLTGFFPALERTFDPPLAETAEEFWLRVELLRRQDDALFVDGHPNDFRGLIPRWTGQGPLAPVGARYPLSYRVMAYRVPKDVMPDDLQPYLADPAAITLPGALARDQELRGLAEANAWGRSAHARTLSVIRFLRKRCTYYVRRTRPAGLNLRKVIRRFLYKDPRGVCEEFAVTAAVLLRLVDVPVRVVTGYRTIERDDQGRFRVRARHAHAWIEVALHGAGWVAYDPTPPLLSAASAEPTPTPTPTPTPPKLPSPELPLPPIDLPEVALPSLVGRPLLGCGLALGLAFLACWAFLAPGRLLRAVQARQLREAGEVDADLEGPRQRLFRHLAQRGFTLDGLQTPLEFLALRGPEPGLQEAIDAYTELRFSGRLDASQEAALREALELLDQEGTQPAGTRLDR